jgi:hypothetical protein
VPRAKAQALGKAASVPRAMALALGIEGLTGGPDRLCAESLLGPALGKGAIRGSACQLCAES